MLTEYRALDPSRALASVRDILTGDAPDLRTALFRDLILNTLKCRRDDLDTLDLKVISRALVEFRQAARVFKPYRGIRKVSMFGSARTAPADPAYRLALRFGELAVESGFMVITGGADGIMRAGIEGAGPAHSFGVNIRLPYENSAGRTNPANFKSINFKYFFTRKVFFVMEADAVAVFPGGFGTQDEVFEVLTLLQTGKAPLMPVVLIEPPEDCYWEEWDRFIRTRLLTARLINLADLSFYQIVKTPEQARNYIQFYYSTYHSLRSVRDRLVIRLEKELPGYRIQELNHRFGDILNSGRIVACPPLAEEADEPDLLDKPRLVLDWNRRSAGRLNEMILAVNRMGSEI